MSSGVKSLAITRLLDLIVGNCQQVECGLARNGGQIFRLLISPIAPCAYVGSKIRFWNI